MHITDRQEQHDTTREFIARPALIESLTRQISPGLTVLAAPGGYGKTWLLRQIAQTWGNTPTRQTPLRVWTLQNSSTPLQALRTFCALFGHCQIPQDLDADSIIDTALMAIASASDAHQPGPLIIDMDGAPPSKAVRSLAGRILLDYVNRGRTFVACRHLWSLPIDRVAVKTVFKTADLAFSLEEIRAEHPCETGSAERWMQLAEGWPALCSSPQGWHEVIASGTNTDGLLDRIVSRFSDYMEHALLASLAARDTRLLMQVSIFDAIEPGVLQAVDLGTPWSRLSSLLESGLPVSRQQADWDRIVIHPVFRRFLERRLFARSAVQHHSLHRRAARYFVTAGNCSDALRHAIKTGDPSFEAQIIERCGGWRISWREGLGILGNGSANTLDFSDRYPKAALARIYWQAQTGRIDAAQRGLATLRSQCRDGFMESDLRAIESVILVYRDEPFDELQIRSLQYLDTNPSEDEPLLLPGAATLQAAILNNAGLHERAMLAARGAIAEAETLSSPYVEFYGRWHHATALHGLGRVSDAFSEYQRARALAEDIFGDASGEYRIVSLMATHAAWLAGDDDPADPAPADLNGLYRLHAWFDPYSRILQLAVAISRHRHDRGLEDRVLEDFADVAERRSLSRLKISIHLARAQRALLDAQPEQADLLCETALDWARTSLPAETPTLARVLAPLWLEKARVALHTGQFETATQALAQTRQWLSGIKDSATEMEAGLLEAYVALRSRRYREVAQLFSHCVTQAERSGLRRPFIYNADRIAELIGYARTHALNLDAGTLQRAAALAKLETKAATTTARQAPAGGRLLLTERETDILHFLAEGLSSKEMARRLAIAEGTVKTHRKHLYEKLNTNLRSHAIVKARALGLL